MARALDYRQGIAQAEWFETRAGSTGTAQAQGIGWLDLGLVCVFLIGLYTHYTIMISASVPFPSMPAGVAGLILLWRRRHQITEKAFVGYLVILFLYVVSILVAPDLAFLPRRLNGLIQLTYSITIGYALFLTLVQARRSQVAGLFLTISVIILIGCLLEDYTGLREVSDRVRAVIYQRGVYENDLRDMLLYNRIRPKFFASEPASVTFCFSIFTFVWFVVSRWRWKLFLYVAMVGLGIFAMPGPTLLLMLVMVLPYMMFLASRRNGRLDFARLFRVAAVALVFLGASVVLGQSIFSARLKEISNGNDPSFFYRVQGPAIAGREILRDFPIAGAGLTGEPYIEQRVVNIYVQSPAYSTGWQIVSPATELLINYFWLHWIYLGLFFGVIVGAALTYWLFTLGVPSAAFCWLVWSILGQAAGAYVGPTCWAVLFMAAAAAILYERAAEPARRPHEARFAGVGDRLARIGSLPGDSPQRRAPSWRSAIDRS
ncbi:hypothetical protein [Enhydrobacter sp.]|jgi:hypothetical protein|uniref:hypothetical protein n=1 Tax=Enhydrobacter sp. TaxID=1894999 RepID=UPI002631B076|nr:hypothetical protein [Enhydrobacter sp.]WIM12670.1 MAG: hypothetical protein OJF58_003633 [Enhydrobacter sp.]